MTQTNAGPVCLVCPLFFCSSLIAIAVAAVLIPRDRCVVALRSPSQLSTGPPTGFLASSSSSSSSSSRSSSREREGGGGGGGGGGEGDAECAVMCPYRVDDRVSSLESSRVESSVESSSQHEKYSYL